jgi:TatD DNase family protein
MALVGHQREAQLGDRAGQLRRSDAGVGVAVDQALAAPDGREQEIEPIQHPSWSHVTCYDRRAGSDPVYRGRQGNSADVRSFAVVIDSHCHLDLPAFDADRDAVVARARRAGVDGILVPAVRPATWPALVELARVRAADGVRIALGVHPQVVPELAAGERASLADPTAALIAAVEPARDVVVAIGECGLDGGTADRDEQERLLRAHVRAARALGLPLVLHVLRAHDAAPRILRDERAGEVGGVVHSYSGGTDLIGVYRDLGLAFSFAGPVTYPNARRPVEAARAVPDELLLAETDAPDQAPAAHRGGRSEPAFVADVVAGLAAARGTDAAAIAALTRANAVRVFRAWR